jgi:uncharacterized Tic20 family protein
VATVETGPSIDDRAAALAHLAALSGLLIPFGHLIGPLVWWVAKRRDHSTVELHGRRALEFQLSVTLYLLAAASTGAGLALAPLFVALVVVDVVQIVIATQRALNGRDYRYVLALPLLNGVRR